MQNERFDNQIRRRAQQETLTASQHAQLRLAQAMRKGHGQMPSKQPFRSAWAAAAAVLAITLIVLTLQPPIDAWRREGSHTEQQASFVMANGEPAVTPVPVTVPKGTASASQIGRWIQVDAAFANHTADIWLIDWEADVGNALPFKPSTDLIWLETEVTCEDTASWIIPKRETLTDEKRELTWSYTSYRVVADVLHWMDEDYLQPGQEGYEEQQSLIEDAFSVGALILLTGDWPEGKSGEMQLVLPDSYRAAYPETDALEYYTKIGALEKAETVTESLKCENISEKTSEWLQTDQQIRMFRAETTGDAAMFLIEFAMADREEAMAAALENVHFVSEANSRLPDTVFSLWVPYEDDVTVLQDDQGQWRRLWQFGFTQGVVNSGDSFSFCFEGTDAAQLTVEYHVP